MRPGLKFSSLGKRRAEFTPEGDDESSRQRRTAPGGTAHTGSQALTHWVSALGLVSVTWHSADTLQLPVNPVNGLYGDYNASMLLPDPAQHSHEQPYTVSAAPEWVSNPYVDQSGSIAAAQLQNPFQYLTLPENASHPQYFGPYQQAVRQDHDSEYFGFPRYPKYGCYYVAEGDVSLFPPGTIVRSFGTNPPYCKSLASKSPCLLPISVRKAHKISADTNRQQSGICAMRTSGAHLGEDRQSG